jgi:hypothetical protein
MMAVALTSLLGTSTAQAQLRDFQREANARGLNLEVYMRQVKLEEDRATYTRGEDAPGPGDDPSSWDTGYRFGLYGSNPGNMATRSASFKRGYSAGSRRAQLNAQGNGVAVADTTFPRDRVLGLWERTQILAERYIGHINGMNLHSSTLFLLGEAGVKEAEKFQRTDLTVADSLALNELALERARAMLRAYTAFHEHAYAASQLQPLLIESLERLVQEDLRPDVASREFAEHKSALQAKGVADFQAIAGNLRNSPVTVPLNFEEMGRKLREWIPVLEKLKKVDTLRKTLGSESLSREALEAGYGEYLRYSGSWVSANIGEWQKTALDRMYSGIAGPSPEVAREAERLARPFYTEPGRSPDPAPAPEVRTVAYSSPATTPESPADVAASTAPASTQAPAAPQGEDAIKPVFLGVAGIVGLLALIFIGRSLLRGGFG